MFRMRNAFAALTAAALFTAIDSIHSSSVADTPVVEWDKRQDVEERLRVYGPNLLGDAIDPHTGAITFEHTDVSIPGNSALEVAVRRKRSQGMIYDENVEVEFGDWEIMVPRIHAFTGDPTTADERWLGNRCSNSFYSSFPGYTIPSGYGSGSSTYFGPNEYSEGVIMDVPGAGAMQILESKQGAHWPAAATHVTTEGWYLTCTTASDGGQGFIAHAPNGDTYKFDEYISIDAKALGVWGNPTFGRTRNILAASEVTDVHGNWVKYDYDASGRLTKIHSNDGRQITFSYSGASKLISSVTANGRTWNYSYVNNTYSEDPFIGYTLSGPSKVLRTVTQPDGRSWTMQLDDMTARAGPGDQCPQNDRTLTVTHPYGAVGTFIIREKTHRVSFDRPMVVSHRCPKDPEIVNNSTPPETYTVTNMETMSVVSKTLSGPDFSNATWTYEYESDNGAAGTSGSDRTNWTKVTDPAGAEITYYHTWNDEPLGGKLEKREVRDLNQSGALLHTEVHDYILEGQVGYTFASAGPTADTVLKPSRADEDTVWRFGQLYRTRYTYDSNFSSSTYSFGAPTMVEEWSDISGGYANRRITETDYTHKTGVWVLALPTKVTRNGVVFEEHGYDSLGRRTWTDKFGTRWQDYTYHSAPSQAAGQVNTITNALNEVTNLTSYKRGIPRTVTRRDGEVITRTVDDNGWLTGETDARGFTTGYDYNNMGWLTLIDRPSTHADTVLSYHNLGTSTFYQRSTRGSLRTVTWYDGMFRPNKVRTQALSGGGVTSYVSYEYDIHGRTTFESFPTTATTPVDGKDTTYDALGRPLTVTENVTPFAQTSYEYMAQNRTRVTDPSGAQVSTWRSAYGTPDNGDVIKVVDAMGATTEMTRDIYGNITELTQDGTQNGFTTSVTREFFYDARYNLCRHRAPELGDEEFSYDALDRLQFEASGQPASSVCETPPASDRTEYEYDTLDRITRVDYPAGTPDIVTNYDENGNVVGRYRGGDWTYQYDELNQMTKEKLDIDGRTYSFIYSYTPEGYVTSRNRVNGFAFGYNPNGLGQPKAVRIVNGAYHLSSANYHANGQVADLDFANGHELTQEINPRQLVSKIRVGKSGGPVAMRFDYSYEERGKIDEILDSDGNSPNGDMTFDYDANGRLTNATGLWGTATYKYDALSNIRERAVGSRTVTIDYDANNRVDDVTDTANPFRDFTHDARGNVTNDGRYTFTYDLSDQPTNISGSGGVNTTYEYDGNKKRVKSVESPVGAATKTTYYVYSALTGGLIFKDEVTDGKTTDYASIGPAGVRIENGATAVYTHSDHLGSRVAATDASGAVLWREFYHPFGETLGYAAGANDDNTGYTGHLEDADTGLTYMQARYYDPVMGRFLSPDPIDYQDQLNLYAYVANDPVNAFDPNGERTIWLQVDAWWGETPTKAPHGHRREGFKDNMLMGREATAGIYLSIPTARGQRWDLGIFGSYGKTRGAGGGIGADVGTQQGDDRDLDGRSVVYNGDLLLGGSVIRDGESSTLGGTLGVGPGLGGTRAEITTGAVGIQDAASAIGGLFRDESASFSQNQDGSVTATISRAGSRITRQKRCTSNADGEVSCN